MNDNNNQKVKPLAETESLYYVSQSHCGHEYIWIFDEEGLKTCDEFELIKNEIDKDGNAWLDILWPMGGSNSSATYIKRLSSEEDAKNCILSEADGPDSDDPMLIDIAEYLRTVETDCGSVTQRILDKYGLKAKDLTQTDPRYDELIGLGIKPEDFYGANSDCSYSELVKKAKAASTNLPK